MSANADVLCNRPAQVPHIEDRIDAWLLDAGAPPLFIEAKPSAFPTIEASNGWVDANRTLIDRLLVDFGAIVLRGFAYKTPQDFDRFTSLYEQFSGGYVAGASPRSSVVGNVMESTRLAPHFMIWLHQEMAYLPNYPSRIAFFSRLVPPEGGATIIGDMREFTRRMPGEVRELIERHGVQGVRNYGPVGEGGRVARHLDDKPWDEGFGTTDRGEVEAICAAMGIEPIWNADGSLTVVTKTDGFVEHPTTGERIYRSLLHTNNRTYEHFGQDNPDWDEARKRQAMNTGYTLGNGVPLTDEQSRAVEDLVDDLIIRWKWQDGDILLVDNLQVAHGRDPFVGERETLVALLS